MSTQIQPAVLLLVIGYQCVILSTPIISLLVIGYRHTTSFISFVDNLHSLNLSLDWEVFPDEVQIADVALPHCGLWLHRAICTVQW
jgi:hypothetical protein